MRKTVSMLLAFVLALLAIGIVMLASTSNVTGEARFSDPYYFLKRQLAWLFLSILFGWVAARIDYHFWIKSAPFIALASILLLALVLVPGIGTRIGGSSRWLRLGPFSFQPSEFAKFAVVVGLAAWISRVGRRMRSMKHGLVLPVGGLGLILFALVLEPDFGTALLVGALGMAMLFAGGTRLSHLVVTCLLGLSVFSLFVLHDPVRKARILAFLMPSKHPEVAHHLAQSKIAFVDGGLFGVGLGNSMQKQFYLPEAHTDFIYAIIGEELGFVATAGIVALLIGVLVCGMLIAYKAPDLSGKMLAFGLTIGITLQSAINIGVVTGCLPTTGLPLPFISYGGSSLLMSVCSICVLINIALHSTGDHVDEHTRTVKDRWHRV